MTNTYMKTWSAIAIRHVNDKILSFIATWVEVKTLSEINQVGKTGGTAYFHLYRI